MHQSARLNLASLARLFDDTLPRKGGINDHQLLNILRNNLTSDDYDALKNKPAKEVVELAKQYIQDYQGNDPDEELPGINDDILSTPPPTTTHTPSGSFKASSSSSLSSSSP